MKDNRTLDLIRPTDTLLNKVAAKVTVEDLQKPQLQGVIDRMFELAAGKCHSQVDTRQMVGLAAPQIGVSKRIILIDLTADGNNKGHHLQAFINPRITQRSHKTIPGREGCWSAGNICGNVQRAEKITLEALDSKGKPIKLELEDFVARIAQHETDHLDGIRFPDRIPADQPDKLHWVEPIQFEDYRQNWASWPITCPRERWETMKGGVEEYSAITAASLKDLQQQTVSKALTVLTANPNILGCFLWGSMAVNQNDAFSDVDLMCFMDSEEKTGREAVYEKVGEIYPLLSRLYVYDKYALYLFANGVRLDLDFYKPSEVRQIDRKRAKVLYDPQSFIKQHLSDDVIEHSPRPAWNENDGDLAEWFIWMFRQVYCWRRRAVASDEKSFDKLLMSYNSLSEIRNKLIDIRRYLMAERDYIQKADPDFAERLAKTFPTFTASSMLLANSLLLEEFERQMPEYCGKIGVKYPESEVNELKTMLYSLSSI